MKQIVDLRRGRCPIRFGDDHSQAKWEESCRKQEARMRDAGIQYSPAPGCPLTLPATASGAPKRVVQPGERVTPTDLLGTGLPLMWRLVESGHVLEADVPEEPSAA